MKKSLVKINIRGGILSPGSLAEIVRTAEILGVEDIHLGERQNFYFEIQNDGLEKLHANMPPDEYDYEVNGNLNPNIISSYVAENLFTSSSNWLSEGIYRDVLDSFDYRPSIKINIVDNAQGLVPLFTGNLNFISSAHHNFWYLYVRLKSTQEIHCWPELIYSSNISALSKVIQDLMLGKNLTDFGQLYKETMEKGKFILLDKQKDLELPRIRFPYYEGMNKSGDNYWLGIYRRNNDFSLEFLKSLCALCGQTKIGLVHITPWKSYLIKGIREEDRIKWEKLLGKFGINIRHSSIELNWQIKDGDRFGLKLKKYLIKKFDQRDIRTYGLSFAIRTGPMNISSSIVLERKPVINLFGLKLFNLYDISYSEDFNPNKQNYSLYAQKINKKYLPDYLVELCRFYYEQLNNEPGPQEIHYREEKELNRVSQIFQCSHCFTVYDEAYGEPDRGINAGTPFTTLPEEYTCPLCENPKNDFLEKQMQLLNK